MRSPTAVPARSRRRRSRRGVSMIEGLAAMGILVIGLLGTLQGIAVAATQNAVAGKMNRATSIAHQMRVALEMRGRQAALNGPLSAAKCTPTPSPTLLAAADGPALALGPPYLCITDFDAFEAAAGTSAYMPGWTANENTLFDRVLVYWRGSTTASPTMVPDRIQVVVSFRGQGRVIFAKQFVALYNPALNQAGAEL